MIRFRFYLVTFLFLCGFAVILLRAYQIQVIESKHLKAIAREQYIGTKIIPLKRGAICDREGNKMALNVEMKSIWANPFKIKEKVQTARELSRILKEEQQKILNRLNRRQSFVWIKRRVPKELAKQVMEQSLIGVGMVTEYMRNYPWREIAAHLIGFAGIDNQGLEGLERKYEELLKGSVDTTYYLRDALGQPVSIVEKKQSEHRPHDLILTIDKDIQFQAHQSIKSAIKKTNAKVVQCIVVEPMSGEVLAMALIPEFDPNKFSRYRPYEWRNRIVTDAFEPGSLIMPFLLAASLEEGAVTPYTTFDCGKMDYEIRADLAPDYSSHEVLSVVDIILYSNKIGSIKVGQKLGYEKFNEYLRKFGFGIKTGVDLLGERKGSIWPKDESIQSNQITFFLGYGMIVTSLQIAMAMATLANDGKLMRPYIVKAIVDESGQVIEVINPKFVRRVISCDAARKVTEILEKIASHKVTSAEAASNYLKFAGNSWTAQKLDIKTKTYSKQKHLVVFVGLTPISQPRLVILVMIDDPNDVEYGKVVAESVFKDVALNAFNSLQVKP